MEGLIYGGKLVFRINWASHIVGSKFTIFALFYFVFEGNFPSTSSPGAYIWRSDLTEGFLRYRFGGCTHVYLEGLIFGILRCMMHKSCHISFIAVLEIIFLYSQDICPVKSSFWSDI